MTYKEAKDMTELNFGESIRCCKLASQIQSICELLKRINTVSCKRIVTGKYQ